MSVCQPHLNPAYALRWSLMPGHPLQPHWSTSSVVHWIKAYSPCVCCWSDLREKIWARHSKALLHRLAEWVEYNLVKRVLRAHFYIPTGGRRSRKLHTLPNKPITLQFKTHSRAFVDWVLLLRELRIRINKRLLCVWRKCKDVSSRRRCQDTWAWCVRVVPDDDWKS